MKIIPYEFDKKCDFDMCQNKAKHQLIIGARGNVLMCDKCLSKLKKILKINNGGNNEK